MTGAEVVEEHAKARLLNQADIDYFLAAGVPPLALTRSWFRDASFIGRERVRFDEGRSRFEFERYRPENAQNAYTLLAFDEHGEPADIVAFRPGRRALWLGTVDVLGIEQAFMPRIDGEPIDVWPDLMDWLVAERRGLLVLDPARAFSPLRIASPLRVQTVEQGRALRHALVQTLPQIVVRGEPLVSADGCKRLPSPTHRGQVA